MQSRPHVDQSQRLRIAGICIFLAIITLAVFRQTFHYGFVNLDDDLIVTDNAHITQGFSMAGIAWAFTHYDSFFYTPLTSISHMLDCSMYGLDAGGHHFTNVLIHVISVILLFLVLRRMTGALWRSAFVAALFAIHPLHVESVAWISERKDVLGGLFFMLTLGAYERYARQPQSRVRYLMVALLFTLSLLSKPVVVTLPFLLLLLDYWPLDRFQSAGLSGGKSFIPARLIIEKIPLLLLSAAASVVAVMAQGAAIQTVQRISIPARIGNAMVSCAAYIVQMFHPVGLAVFYPHPGNNLPGWEVIASLLMLVFITGMVWIFRRTHRYLVTGWFWYLGMLVPVAGIVQVGIFARADRFTYLSQIGLYIMGTWALAGLCARWQRGRLISSAIMSVVILELTVIAWGQASYWKNSVDLWTHTASCTTGNFQAENSLGAALYDEGRMGDALPHFEKAQDINPLYAEAQNNLGGALLVTGKTDDAILHFRKALEINPRLVEVRNSLGDALYKKGEDQEAIAQYKMALAISPEYIMARSNLAWLLATSPKDSVRNGAKALQLAREAYSVAGERNPQVIRTLAAAYAGTGQFSEAEEAAQRAMQVADAQGNARLVALLRSEIALYRAHLPYRHEQSVNVRSQPSIPPAQ